jgi:protein involved in polysaccharide export with SLBB domain
MKFLAFCVSCAIPCVAQLDYTLHPSDRIYIRVSETAKFSGRAFKIGPDGFVNLPLIGWVRAGGVTVKILEKQLTERLSNNVPSPPNVTITVVGTRSPNLDAPAR